MSRPGNPYGDGPADDWATRPAYGRQTPSADRDDAPTAIQPNDSGQPASVYPRGANHPGSDRPESTDRRIPSEADLNDLTQVLPSPAYRDGDASTPGRAGAARSVQRTTPQPRQPAAAYPPAGYAPGYQQPGYQQPGYQQPGHRQPGYQQPGYQDPGYQPPGYQPPLGQPPGGPPPGRPARRRRPRWGRRIGLALLAVVLLLAGFAVYLDVSLTRVDALVDYPGRPAETPGTDWLLVGSDSREELSEDEQSDLATGFAKGKRTDTIILVHVPDSDTFPTVVSLPRDSLVSIAGHGQQKLNAAYAFGGPQLLVRTVEGITKIRIDRYAEIGLAGFANMVDALGGVHVCLDQPINDPKAGINLPAGCQDLDGPNALGYVRTRATARADLDRVVRQRQLLSILVGKATSFGTIVNPFRSVPFALAATGSFAVDDSAHLWHLAGLGFALGDSELVTTTVPIAGTPTLDGVGSVVEWDEQGAAALFGALAKDQAVPAALVTK